MANDYAIADQNRTPALTAHSGTAGTAEVRRIVGTTDGALLVYNVGPAGSVTLGDITGGTINRIEGGSIAVTAGTFDATIVLDTGTITTGSLANIGQVHNAGTIAALPNIPGGTIGLVTRVGNVGTLEVGTISTLPNIPGGTIGVISSVANLAAGTVTRLEGGTLGVVSSVANLAAGTVTRLEQGSVNVTAGTFRNDGRPTRNVLSYGTQFGGTAAGYATLIGSAAVGVGTSLYMNEISISNTRSASLDTMIGLGTALQGTSVFLRDQLGTSIGIGREKSYTLAPNNGMTNQDLVVWIGGAGTIDVNVSYFIST